MAPSILEPPLLASPGGLRELASGRSLSGPALEAAAASRAAELARGGVGPGSRVLLEARPGADFVVELLALWRAGACAAPFDPALPLPARAALAAACGGPGAAGEALILQTSGTAAGPKGVILSRRALASRLAALRAAVPAPALERSLCVLPLHHGHGLIGSLLLALSSGGEAVLAPLGAEGGFDLGAAVEEARATFVSAVPALWRAALRVSRPPRRGLLRRAHSASSPLDAALRAAAGEWAAGAALVDAYGMTEACGWVSGSEPGETRPGVVGRGWGASLRVSGSGEVELRTESLFSGYCGAPAAPAADGWHRTGDRGVLEPDGSLRLLGRLDELVDRGGEKVAPEEVEAALSAHPAVAEACAFGVPHPLTGQEVAAAVVWRGAPRPFAELERWCADRLSPSKVPRRWLALERLPRNGAGKTLRRELACAIIPP